MGLFREEVAWHEREVVTKRRLPHFDPFAQSLISLQAWQFPRTARGQSAPVLDELNGGAVIARSASALRISVSILNSQPRLSGGGRAPRARAPFRGVATPIRQIAHLLHPMGRKIVFNGLWPMFTPC